MEHVLRSWRIAERLAGRMVLPEDQRWSLFHVSMLAWVGCVADSPEVAASFGDDIAFRADSYGADLAGLEGFGFFLRRAGLGRPIPAVEVDRRRARDHVQLLTRSGG